MSWAGLHHGLGERENDLEQQVGDDRGDSSVLDQALEHVQNLGILPQRNIRVGLIRG